MPSAGQHLLFVVRPWKKIAVWEKILEVAVGE